MHKHFIAVIMCVSVLLSGFRVAENWIPYKSVPGHFSVSFPGKAEESVEDQKTDNGVPFKMHIASYSVSDNEVYLVGWIDMHEFYPAEKTMKQLLEDSRDGATGAMTATDVKTTETKLTGDPFIEFTFSANELTGKERIYIIDKFQYSVIALYDKTGVKPVADKFIASFKHAR